MIDAWARQGIGAVSAACLALLLSSSIARAAEPDPSPLPLSPEGERGRGEGVQFFESKIRPVLVQNCYECHSAGTKARGGLLLDSRAGVLKGSDNGAVVVPGKPNESLLLKALRHEDGLKMPPKLKLSDAVVADFETWIKMGVPDPRDGKNDTGLKPLTLEEGRKFWAFQQPRPVAPPKVKNESWPKDDLDRFTLAAMEARGVQPVGDAGPLVLLRRLYFDLIGLLPTPEEIAVFEKEYAVKPQAAIEALVERLLASPHYGERWGRHWLDVARYADSDGTNGSASGWQEAWRYRDYVIDSFNRDRPYHQFIAQQIAGDLLGGATPQERDEGRTATGFLVLGNKKLPKFDQLEEKVGTVGSALLGLTINCARCHDHKYDPVSQKDYYAFAAILNNVAEVIVDVRTLGKRQKVPPGLESDPKAHPLMVVDAVARGRGRGNLAVHISGDATNLGELVPRGLPQIFANGKPAVIPDTDSGRKQIARWLTSTENPLTARVLVNRVWHHLYGRGLVASVDNFSNLGERPSHPELLDYLALRFMQEGWSVKQLIRHIVLSRTYQLAYRADKSNEGIDPDNVLLWRHAVRQLDAESVRDALLAAGGALERQPLRGTLLSQMTFGQKGKVSAIPETHHRSIYVPVVRNHGYDVLNTFDFPDPSLSVGRRDVSTVPTQALFFLNHELVMKQADALARRVTGQHAEDRQRLELTYRTTFGRLPDADEVARDLAFLKKYAQAQKSGRADDRQQAAWTALCHALLASSEFRFIR